MSARRELYIFDLLEKDHPPENFTCRPCNTVHVVRPGLNALRDLKQASIREWPCLFSGSPARQFIQTEFRAARFEEVLRKLEYGLAVRLIHKRILELKGFVFQYRLV